MRKPGEKNPDELLKKKRKAERKKEEIIRKKEEPLLKAQKEEERLRVAEEEFRRLVDESDGFDIGPGPWYFADMSAHRGGVDCPLVAQLYAKVGLHRYNLLQGTNLRLHKVEKYNQLWHLFPIAYFITSLAEDPATSSRVVFQSDIDQRELGQIDIACYTSRPKGIKSTQLFDFEAMPKKWPSKEDFADQSRFLYKLQESDWEEHDWIRLYMQLSFFNTKRSLENHYLSGLKILDVVVETVEENVPCETLLKSFRNVLVYIRYDQVLGEDGVSKHIAIVRRTVDPTIHALCLKGVRLLLPDSE